MKNLAGFSIFLMCFGLGVWLYSDSTESARRALDEFYNYKGFEDDRSEPLYHGGAKVIPLVIERVKDKNMPYRIDAIAFLGNKENAQALPVLEQIAKDETEDSFIRKEALESIFLIDENTAKNLAGEYKARNDSLGNYANCILTEKNCI